MKKILFLSLFISLNLFGQSTLITPNGSGNGSTLIKKDGIGIDHQDETGAVRVGTYSNVGIGAFIQTHSAHPLRFTVANGLELMRLSYSTTPSLHGNLGIATPSPQEKLHVTGNIRASSLAGTGTRPVLADVNGTLLPITTPQVWSISGGAFTSETQYAVNFFKTSLTATFAPGSSGKMTAPVNLPTGVTISEIKVFYQDASTSSMNIRLYEQILQNQIGGGVPFTLIANFTSINVTGTQSANLTLLTTNPIDNANRAYFLEVDSSTWTAGLSIYGIKITYSY